MRIYARFIKRPLDAVLSAVALVALSPLLLLIALVIRADSKGGVLFSQKRIGKNRKPFMIYKFRTMFADAPHDVPKDEMYDPMRHITRVGRFLRASSLDELPQIVNILRGDMAIVGPRPALWNQYELIAAREAVGANSQRPGLTGLAQVRGRDELEVSRKARLDGLYCGNVTFVNDAKLILRTMFYVVTGRHVVEGGKPRAAKNERRNARAAKEGEEARSDR